MTQLAVPSWVKYVVVEYGTGHVAPFTDIDAVVRTISRFGLARRCEVIRVEGDVSIWPMKVRGGEA